ncbi:MAG TPA: ribonuclease P protein component [Burkholderiaceae bacterium]|nr:ribonuclease P protein component [Burkholderiaceae bacterium]
MGAAALPKSPRSRLPRRRRLRRPAEFAAVQAAARADSLRAQTPWLALTAYWRASDQPGARLGLTVSKRMARRAVDRALVKRIAREAFRGLADDIERAAAAAGMKADLSIRLKRPLGPPGTSERPGLMVLRHELRTDADELMAAVITRLKRIAADV